MTPEEREDSRKHVARMSDQELGQLYVKGQGEWPDEAWLLLEQEVSRRERARRVANLTSSEPRDASGAAQIHNGPLGLRTAVGLIGSVLLFLGVFAPVITAPIVGPQNYFQNGQGDGVIVAMLALASIGAVLARYFRALWLTGLASLGVLGFTFVNFQQKLSELQRGMNRDLADNPFRGLADMALQSVQIQWGWAVLVVGAILLLIAAGMGPAQPSEGAV
jgi:hypothetical protein